MAKNYIVNSNKFNFAGTVNEVLQGNWYAEGVIPAMQKAVDEVSKEAVKKLKATSPKNSGKYAKGWASR